MNNVLYLVIINLKGFLNCMIGSKVTATLMTKSALLHALAFFQHRFTQSYKSWKSNLLNTKIFLREK